jgi:hypothetical protein
MIVVPEFGLVQLIAIDVLELPEAGVQEGAVA